MTVRADTGPAVTERRVPRAPDPQRVRRGSAMSAAALAVPPTVVPNRVIAERLGVADGWIEKRTGVVERHVAVDGEQLTDCAAEAALQTLERAAVRPDQLDLVLVATMTPDAITPNAAPLVARRAGLGRVPTADVGSACTGWLAGVSLAAAQVECGRADRVLVIGADFMSRVTDPYDRATAAIFADGAGSVLVSACEGRTLIGPVVLGTDTEGVPWIYASHEDGAVRMRGSETFGAAVARLVEATQAALHAAGLSIEDIDLFAYHQGNGRIIKAVGQRLELPAERVWVSVDHFGNTSAASIPMALAEASAQGALKPGMKVLVAAFGAGLTYGAAVVEWGG